MIYFDNAATALPHPVIAERLPAELAEYFANPSSLHHQGIKVQHRLDQIRGLIGRLVQAKPNEIIFTSGGTEANNLCLQGSLQPGDHLITSAIEHASIRELIHQLPGVAVTELIDITAEATMAAIQPNTRLVSIMHVNNETGHLFELPGLYRELKKRGISFHRDGVQSFGKLAITTDYDFLTISGHKLGAFKGVGALIAKGQTKLRPLVYGGAQERGLRPGTENIPGLLAWGLVLEAEAGLMTSRLDHVTGLNQALRLGLQDEVTILSPQDASPYILSLAVPGIPSEIILNALSAKGIYLSAGSACSSKSKHHSHVIAWLTSDPALRAGALRLSLSWQNTQAEVDQFIREFTKTITQLRKVIR